MRNPFKKKQKPELQPMKVRQVGQRLPFNEMAEKQNISIHHLNITTK